MKKQFLVGFVIAFTALVVSSCKKDEESLGERLSELKAVEFPDKGDEVINSKVNRELGGGKKELIQVVKKSMPIDPVELVDTSNLDVIYPGSILRGDSFMEGGLDPIAVVNPKEVTISISLQGRGYNVKRTTIPSVSNIRQQMNDLKTEDRKSVV